MIDQGIKPIERLRNLVKYHPYLTSALIIGAGGLLGTVAGLIERTKDSAILPRTSDITESIQTSVSHSDEYDLSFSSAQHQQQLPKTDKTPESPPIQLASDKILEDKIEIKKEMLEILRDYPDSIFFDLGGNLLPKERGIDANDKIFSYKDGAYVIRAYSEEGIYHAHKLPEGFTINGNDFEGYTGTYSDLNGNRSLTFDLGVNSNFEFLTEEVEIDSIKTTVMGLLDVNNNPIEITQGANTMIIDNLNGPVKMRFNEGSISLLDGMDSDNYTIIYRDYFLERVQRLGFLEQGNIIEGVSEDLIINDMETGIYTMGIDVVGNLVVDLDQYNDESNILTIDGINGEPFSMIAPLEITQGIIYLQDGRLMIVLSDENGEISSTNITESITVDGRQITVDRGEIIPFYGFHNRVQE